MTTVTPAGLRAFAAARAFGPRTTLRAAIEHLGYVQADPIRAPARAQDLILMQRVRGYRAGDLERFYPKLDVEEDVLQNYGFIPRSVQRLVHPRGQLPLRVEREAPGLLERVLEVVHERGSVHPRDLDAHFGRERTTNYWGGKSSLTTRALEGLHYRGFLRVARREGGVRVYEPARHLTLLRDAPVDPSEQAEGLVRLVLRQLAPIPSASLRHVTSLLGYGAPHLKAEIKTALKTLPARRATVDGVTYLWPDDETPDGNTRARVRIVAPFDPLVWDRRRFEHLHGWAYRFEAYTPAAKRQYGYYALPLLYGERVIGWANLSVKQGELHADVGYAIAPPRSQSYRRALEAELDRYRAFLSAPVLPELPR